MTRRHVHRRSDGLAVICMRASCRPGAWRDFARRALLIACPFLLVASSRVFGPRATGIALALLVPAALITWGTCSLGTRLERDAQADERPRGRAAPRGGASPQASA